MAEPQPEPDEQELLRRLEEELGKLRVSDVLAQTVLTASQLGWRRLAPERLDLAEARLAIDAVKALLALIRETLPPDDLRDLGQMLANLQLAYAKAASEAPEPPAEPDPAVP